MRLLFLLIYVSVFSSVVGVRVSHALAEHEAADAGAVEWRQEEIARAEEYFKALQSVHARFLQRTMVDGAVQELSGDFYLKRPGKLRFEYDKSDDFVVADGLFIYFYDSELGEQTNAPIGSTLANLVLCKDIRFDGDIEVAGVKQADGDVYIRLVKSDDPAAGSIELVFSEEPYEFKKWVVRDAQNHVTEVEFDSIDKVSEFPSGFFAYRDPDKSHKYND